MPTQIRKLNRICSILLISLLLLAQFVCAANPQTLHWYKGNLHTHSLWSDGDDYPEMVADWYKNNGYHFLALSDHNKLSQGQKWLDITHERAGEQSFKKYLQRFGENWVQQRIVDGTTQIRLKPLSEFRCFFEEPERFLLIQAEEITQKKAHVNAINLIKPIPKQPGETAIEVMQNCINAVISQSSRTGQIMLTHINHPNYKWMVTAEDIMHLKDAKFFEVYNYSPNCNNRGDEDHPSTERMWDIVLTKRLTELNLPIIYGIATDDTHSYHNFGQKYSNPGRGWVVVRCSHLTPESIIKAMDKGDFYASLGVELQDIQFDGKTLKIEIKPQKGITYTTQFIATLKTADMTSKPVTDANGVELHITQRYSDDIGKVVSQIKGTAAAYTLTGNEIYVRAKVISTKPKANPVDNGDVEVAWIQPVIPKIKDKTDK